MVVINEALCIQDYFWCQVKKWASDCVYFSNISLKLMQELLRCWWFSVWFGRKHYLDTTDQRDPAVLGNPQECQVSGFSSYLATGLGQVSQAVFSQLPKASTQLCEQVLPPGFHQQILCFPPPPPRPGNMNCSVENFPHETEILNIFVS